MGMGRGFGRIGMRRARERTHIEGVLCEYSSFPGGSAMQMFKLMELNRYRQQAISSLTRTPSDMFQGNGNNFKKLGKTFFCLTSLISINQSNRVRILVRSKKSPKWIYNLASRRTTDFDSLCACCWTRPRHGREWSWSEVDTWRTDGDYFEFGDITYVVPSILLLFLPWYLPPFFLYPETDPFVLGITQRIGKL